MGNAVKYFFWGKHCLKCNTVWEYECDSVPTGRQLIATGASRREPVVRDETTAEVLNGTTGIAIGICHAVLSGLNITSKHLTTGSRPWLPLATRFVAKTNHPFAFTMPFI